MSGCVRVTMMASFPISVSDGGFVETGAQFIHGERGNQLFGLAKKYGLLMGRTFQSTCLTTPYKGFDLTLSQSCEEV